MCAVPFVGIPLSIRYCNIVQCVHGYKSVCNNRNDKIFATLFIEIIIIAIIKIHHQSTIDRSNNRTVSDEIYYAQLGRVDFTFFLLLLTHPNRFCIDEGPNWLYEKVRWSLPKGENSTKKMEEASVTVSVPTKCKNILPFQPASIHC